jgi:hypothetical protein
MGKLTGGAATEVILRETLQHSHPDRDQLLACTKDF